MPNCDRLQTACSRLKPQPQFRPAINTRGAAYAGRLSTKSVRGCRSPSKRRSHSTPRSSPALPIANANRYIELISAVLNDAFNRGELTHAPSIPYAPEVQNAPVFLTQKKAGPSGGTVDPLNRMARFALATDLREANLRELAWRKVDVERRCAGVRMKDAKAAKSMRLGSAAMRCRCWPRALAPRIARVRLRRSTDRLQGRRQRLQEGPGAGQRARVTLARPASYLRKLARDTRRATRGPAETGEVGRTSGW